MTVDVAQGRLAKVVFVTLSPPLSVLHSSEGSLLFLFLSVKLICEAEWGQGCCWYHTRLSSSEVLLGRHCLFAFCLVSKSQTSLSFLLGKQGQHSETCRGPHFTKTLFSGLWGHLLSSLSVLKIPFRKTPGQGYMEYGTNGAPCNCAVWWTTKVEICVVKETIKTSLWFLASGHVPFLTLSYVLGKQREHLPCLEVCAGLTEEGWGPRGREGVVGSPQSQEGGGVREEPESGWVALGLTESQEGTEARARQK